VRLCSPPPPTQAFSPLEVAQITHDFIHGNVPLPPRFRERGPDFSWSAHVRGWWQRLAGRVTTTTNNTGSAAVDGARHLVVDFDAAMANPVAAVEQLQQYLSSRSRVVVGSEASAAVIAARASREATARLAAGASSHPNTAAEAEFHFPNAGGSGAVQGGGDRPSWADDFWALPAPMQDMFNRSHEAAWDLAGGNRERSAAAVVLLAPAAAQ
jgi:hypothetical protein